MGKPSNHEWDCERILRLLTNASPIGQWISEAHGWNTEFSPNLLASRTFHNPTYPGFQGWHSPDSLTLFAMGERLEY
jgi:hypothetical protein